MIEKLCIKTDSKIVLLVIDGVGGVPLNGLTELDKAHTPNLDALAQKSITGLTDPIAPGITPGSGPAHISLFGYDPVKYEIGRGVLEALGVGIELTSRDIAVRGNFASIDKNRVIIDRRAGRISTEKNKELCQMLQQKIKMIEDVEIHITPGKEYRFVLVLRGDGLDDNVNETDPQKTGEMPIPCRGEPVCSPKPEAEKTARIINEFVRRAEKFFSPPADGVLLRGFAKKPDIPSMNERFKLSSCAIATYPMYKGLSRLVGMDVVETGTTIKDEIETLKNNYKKYDFFYFHIKKPDSMGEDGNFEGKVKMIEEVDSIIPEIERLNPDVFVVTGDHSTPAVLKAHSWHPNPFLLYSKYILTDEVKKFTERECAKGYLGRFNAINAIPLMLAYSLKLKKFGA